MALRPSVTSRCYIETRWSGRADFWNASFLRLIMHCVAIGFLQTQRYFPFGTFNCFATTRQSIVVRLVQPTTISILSHSRKCCTGGSRIFRGGDFGNPSERSEHWGGLGLRENEIWAFVIRLFNMISNYSHFWLFLSVIGYSQVGIVTEYNFSVQWRRQDLARGGAQNDIEITWVTRIISLITWNRLPRQGGD